MQNLVFPSSIVSLLSCALACFLLLTKSAVAELRQGSGTTSADQVDFRGEIQPILARRCFACHGPDSSEGELRLDIEEGKGELRGALDVLVPFAPAESLLFDRISADTIDQGRMPPEGEPLSEEKIEVVRRWIEQGAPWQRHWSFDKPVCPELPELKDTVWMANAIDAFVMARLEEEGIAPSPEAERAALLRRLCLDLTGLPPTAEDQAGFLHDEEPDAYQRLVDRLLASPRFGERWGRHWLDLARYADSDGYEQDRDRPFAWRWRDWVTESINRDQPFDLFTRDQLAGDLLSEGTVDQVVATGFHRNSLINREGGVDPEEDRIKYTVDRLNTVGSVWLGLTVGCAECHNHKYDAIEQEEYYRLYAFFNSLDNRRHRAPLPQDRKRVTAGREHFRQAQREYVAAHEDDVNFEEWVGRVAALPDIWVLPDSYDLPTFNATLGSNLFLQEDGSFFVTGWVREADFEDNYTASINTPLEQIRAIRVEVLSDSMLPGHGPGWSARGNFVLAEVEIESSPLSSVTELTRQEVIRVVADYSQPGHDVATTVDGNVETGWSVDMPELPLVGMDRAAVYVLERDAGYQRGTRFKVLLKQKGGTGLAKIARFRVMMTSAEPEVALAQAIPESIKRLARLPNLEHTDSQKAKLLRYYHSVQAPDQPTFRRYAEKLAQYERALGDVWAMTVRQRMTNPRLTRVHHRGDFLSPVGDPLVPGTPSALHQLVPRGKKADRIDLAEWLSDRENPLTARVTVNRIWMRLFGEGLVRSVADFGTQGELPSHPRLLDWLATEFVRIGWSRKALVRCIVTSATYRQSSTYRSDLASRDAMNKLLARQNRLRLAAEVVRDSFLASSGLMDWTVGGPTVEGSNCRRGYYVRQKRKALDPMFATFDAPDTMVACMRRERSNTPLQALELMNGPLFVQAARALAGKVCQIPDLSLDERLELAYRFVLGRDPDRMELAELGQLFETAVGAYQNNPKAVIQLVGVDPSTSEAGPDRAAWVILARTIFNMDEVVMRP